MKSFLLILTIATLSLNGCAQSIQTEESQTSDISSTPVTVESETSETHFLPESEGWSKFKNENITFSYPEGFTVTEQGENVYLTNSDSTAPLGMAQGELWINFTPTTEEEMNREKELKASPNYASEGVAAEDYSLNSGTGEWYKIQLLMGGNGQATPEAEEIFEKVESTFWVL